MWVVDILEPTLVHTLLRVEAFARAETEGECC